MFNRGDRWPVATRQITAQNMYFLLGGHGGGATHVTSLSGPQMTSPLAYKPTPVSTLP